MVNDDFIEVEMMEFRSLLYWLLILHCILKI